MDSLMDALNQLKSALENTLWSSGSPADSDTSRPPKNSFPPHLRASNNKNVHTVGSQGLLETIFSKEGILDAFHMFQKDTSNFLRAVDWSEPFIMVLLGFHVCFFIWILAKRKDSTATIWNLATAGVLALCSEFFNDMGGKNYERFARTNYFDRNGVFVTTMFSMPMLLHMFLAVVLLMVELARTMVKAKRLQLQERARVEGSGAAGSKKAASK